MPFARKGEYGDRFFQVAGWYRLFVFTVGKNTVVGCHWMTVRFPPPPPPLPRRNACIERICSTSKIASYFDVATLKRREPLCFSIHERSYYTWKDVASRRLYSNFSFSFTLEINLTRIDTKKCTSIIIIFIIFNTWVILDVQNKFLLLFFPANHHNFLRHLKERSF